MIKTIPRIGEFKYTQVKSKISLFLLSIVVLSCCDTITKKEHYPSGTLKISTEYKENLPHGNHQSYYSNGNIESKGRFKNGTFHGKWEEWYQNGKIRSIIWYELGKMVAGDYWDEEGNHVIKQCTGTLISKYPNGKLKSIQTFKDCKMHDKWVEWFENGNKEREMFFEEGIAIGTWTYWNEDGSILKVEKYSLGVLEE